MSKIEEMLKRLCPNGVERKPLVQAVSVKRGVRVVKQQLAETGVYPVYQNCLTAMGYYAESNCSGDTAFVIAAGAAGSVGYCDVDFWAADDCYYMVAPKEINNKFLYYTMKSKEPLLLSKVRKASVPRLARDVVESMEIPLPPRPVQDEIVKALDAMAAVVKSLEEERAARQEQFEAVRERTMKALASKQDLLHSLSEICSIKNGGDYKSFGPGPYPVYGSGGVMTHVDHYAYDKPSVLLPRKGSIDRIYYVEKPFWNVDTIYYTIINEGVWPKYFYHYMTIVSMARYNKAGGVPSLTQGDWNRQFVPIPTFVVQKKIAEQLDAFAAVVAALDEEVAARREQFAGWLEKLMKFDAKEVAVA